MPYIPQGQRWQYQEGIDALEQAFEFCSKEDTTAHFNYVVSTLMRRIFLASPSYRVGSSLRAALHDAADEFYRREMAPYEDKKISENGDLE